ncbi:hypothetical protein O9992_14300 [Vibrio lentus]|nr:hypothetical protein [Vibrio lentus]
MDEIFLKDEFERLLDELHGKKAVHQQQLLHQLRAASARCTSAGTDGGDITDDEFEKLLDELHGAEARVRRRQGFNASTATSCCSSFGGDV